MNALILAAGTGNRLEEATSDRPKALVNVAGKELLRYVLDFLDAPIIRHRTIITGYKADHINDFLKNQNQHTATIHNPHFHDGSIRSIEAAIPAMNDSFLLMNTDHIYPQRILGRILSKRQGLMVVCDFDRKLVDDDMKVQLDAQQHLTAIRKTLPTYDCGYIGMTYCDASMIETYQQGIREVRKIYGDEAPVEWVLGYLAAQGVKISIADVSGIGWLEVDTPSDLQRAEETLFQDPNFLT